MYEEITVNEILPNATFNYYPEYYIDFKTDPPQIASLPGSNWYKEGTALKFTAQAQIAGTSGTQYRFSYWLLPTGEKLNDVDLSWMVSAPGKVVATYDTYYELTVTSPYGKADGSGWYKSGTAAKWSVSPTEVAMSGLWGVLPGKQNRKMPTAPRSWRPRNNSLAWKGDYTMPIIFIVLFVVVLGVVVFFVYRQLHPPVPRPAVTAPAPAPAPPTIVFLGGGATKSSSANHPGATLGTVRSAPSEI